MHHKEQYVISHTHRHGLYAPPSCLPVGYDTTDLIDVSSISDGWAKFLNTRTGETIDCAVFAARILKLEEEDYE